MDNVKKTFEDISKEFDRVIIKLIPYYKHMLDALVLSIPFQADDKIRIADLGCGTGTVSKLIKKKNC